MEFFRTLKGQNKETNFLNYILFVTFFPHLIAGPIIHHKEMMPQFDNLRNKFLNYKNICTGIFLFILGLFKKVIIADTFAIIANAGFTNFHELKLVEAWLTTLSYTFQIYFDFSGYTDMALGIALLFNIVLPQNFNSPYKAPDIREFWKRWHMTLSRFLKQYVYIPLGGNKVNEYITYQNLIITFLIGGIWHGAGWTFILWGLVHGIGIIINRIWSKLGINLNKFLCWFITFNFVNVSWIFFRAKNLNQAVEILRSLIGLKGFMSLPKAFLFKFPALQSYGFSFDGLLASLRELSGNMNPYILMAFTVTGFVFIRIKDSNDLEKDFKPNWTHALIAILLFTSIQAIIATKSSEFLYFNF